MARRKKQRPEDEELNLTPFIDLFSTLVVFLLLTAVWLQINSLSTNVENTKDTNSASRDAKVSLAVTILKNKIEMSEDDKATQLPLELTSKGLLDSKSLIKELNEWRQRYPKRKDIVLNTQNEIPYSYMIQVFDVLVGQGWSDVGVNTQ